MTDESRENFINANLIHKQVIASQCPLTSLSNGYEDTIDDLKRMIIEKQVSYWVSLAPHLPKEKSRIFDMDEDSPFSLSRKEMKTRRCTLFPLQFLLFNDSRNVSKRFSGRMNQMGIKSYSEKYLDGISNFKIQDMPNVPLPYVNMTYTVSAYFPKGTKSSDSSKISFRDDFLHDNMEWEYRSQKVNHIWYYNWEDFITPPMEDLPALHNILDESAAILERDAESVALITCFSGRGRSGTLSALLVSKLVRISTVDELVNIIVSMREYRDGLVETPEQFEFIVDMLRLNKSATKLHVSSISSPCSTMDFIVSTCLLFVTIFAILLASGTKC